MFKVQVNSSRETQLHTLYLVAFSENRRQCQWLYNVVVFFSKEKHRPALNCEKSHI